MNKNKTKPFIIGEVASAHEGNYKTAIKIGKAAFASGADAVKFQIFKSKLLLSSKNSLFKKFQKLEISKKNWIKVFKKFNKRKILIAEVFDLDSLKFASSLNTFKFYKIPSTCLTEKDMLVFLKRLNKPVILATGGATLSEIKYALRHLKLNKDKVTIMAGFQNFPTKIRNSNLSIIKSIKNLFKTKVGYADHTDSNNDFFSYSIPIIAYTLGAEVIEKHITLNRKKKGTDHQSSLDPQEFKKFVERLKMSSKVFSNNNWKLTEAENNYRKFNKKFAVLKNSLNKRDKIKSTDIEFKRTNQVGITKEFLKKIVGKRLKNKKFVDEIILAKDLL